MSDHKRSVRVGAAAIMLAAVFRLACSPLPGKLLSRLIKSNIPAAAIYSETGQDVRFSSSKGGFFLEFPAESAAPVILKLPEKPDFAGDPLPELTNSAALEFDMAALLAAPLAWSLRGETPTVLIYSTHATESYTKAGEDYTESAAWRTLDEEHNMISIGQLVAQLLEEAGIRVIHDRELHDYPSYNGSYAHARGTLEGILAENTGILLALDLHRDAADAPGGGQLRTRVSVGGKDCAQLMLVMGSGHALWQENLSLALKLCAQLERQAPGITRPIQLRRAAFNQDLGPKALLVEVGAAGNSRAEALMAAGVLADAIIALAQGTA